MTRIMVGPLILLAASVATQPAPAGGGASMVGFTPTGIVTARATATVRIVAGVRHGRGKTPQIAGSQRRQIRLVDAAGIDHPADLIEFQ